MVIIANVRDYMQNKVFISFFCVALLIQVTIKRSELDIFGARYEEGRQSSTWHYDTIVESLFCYFLTLAHKCIISYG